MKNNSTNEAFEANDLLWLFFCMFFVDLAAIFCGLLLFVVLLLSLLLMTLCYSNLKLKELVRLNEEESFEKIIKCLKLFIRFKINQK